MRVNVYIDGFNLFYGALKGTPHKWLDLTRFCELSLPRDTIGSVRYFTARVKPKPNDLHCPERQSVYLRALETLPNLTIHEGTFRERKKDVHLLRSGKRKPQRARALVFEEKGSDVNLATYLLIDGFRGDYEAAVIISDDSDLIEPIRMVRSELGFKVGILNPQEHYDRKGARVRRYELEKAVTSGFYRDIDRTLLPKAQLPNPVIAADGSKLSKPTAW